MAENLKGEPEHFPRMEGQQSDVMPGSSLAILAVFTEIVRQRFRNDGELAWLWTPNATPAADAENTEDAPSHITIEPSFAENENNRNARPAIWIDHGDIIPSKVAIGNFVGQKIKTGLRGYYALTLVPIDIEVISAQRGESAVLADLVWFYLLAGREMICKTFGLQDMTNPVLTSTRPFEADKTAWSTHVSFNISLNTRWSTLPVERILREIVTKYRDSKSTNFDEFLLTHYLR